MLQMIQLKAHALFIAYGLSLPLLCCTIRILRLWIEIHYLMLYALAFIISNLVGYSFNSLPASTVEPILKSRLLRQIVDVADPRLNSLCVVSFESLCVFWY